MRVEKLLWESLRIAILLIALLGAVAVDVLFHLNGWKRGEVVVVLLCTLAWIDAWMYRDDKPWLRFAAAGLLSLLAVRLIVL